MKKLVFLAIAATFFVVACTDNEQFRVNGTIVGNTTMNMRVGYYANGMYRTQITAAREGEFEFFGTSRQPTVVDIFDYEYHIMARLYAANGQNLQVTIDRSKPFDVVVEGNAASSEWASFLRQNTDSLTAGSNTANSVIARYILAHPDNIVSTLLLTNNFNTAADPELADSLLAAIEPQARPSTLTDSYNYLLQRIVAESATDTVASFRYVNSKDSICTFDPSDHPRTVLVFSDEAQNRATHALPLLRRYADSKKVYVLEIGLDPEFSDWRRYTAADSSAWNQGWLPGGPMAAGIEHLAVPQTPFYVVVDSTGHQMIRATSPAPVNDILNNL